MIGSSSNAWDSLIEPELWNTGVHSIATTVYVRVRCPNLDGSVSLHGTIRGPFSGNSQTLPATFALADLGAGATVLGKAHVTDPCAWTTQSPSRYRLDVNLRRKDEIVAEFQTEFGIRHAYAAGKSLWMGQRTVLRGVDSGRALWANVADWNECRAAMLVRQPDDSLCQQATSEGVAVVARLTDPNSLVSQITRLARHPCVQIVWLDWGRSSESVAEAIAKVDAPNLLLAADACDSALVDGTDVAMLRVGDLTDEAIVAIDKPVIAVRPLEGRLPLAESRAACERLQRDLAPALDLAGYFV